MFLCGFVFFLRYHKVKDKIIKQQKLGRKRDGFDFFQEMGHLWSKFEGVIVSTTSTVNCLQWVQFCFQSHLSVCSVVCEAFIDFDVHW